VSNPVDGVERAQLVRKTGQKATLVVHFNPASLQYTITNTLENKGSGNSKKQYVTQSSGKLTFDLVFDTTDTGADVRAVTEQVAKLMEPENKVPPVVSFEWGVYKFQGIVESYKETIDFFAANGVPLRSTINLTLAKQDQVFEPTKHDKANTSGTLPPDTIQVPSSGGAAGVGAQGGDPRAARGIAAANGEESLRFPSSDSLAISDAVPLAPPVAFASGSLTGGLSAGISGGFGVSGGAGFGISGGAGIGVSGGFGVSGGAGIGLSGGLSGGISGGFGLSGGAGIGISGGLSGGISGGVSGGAVFGGRASARVTAAGGAFAGLRASAPERRLDRLRVDLLQPRPESSSLGTDEEASFQLGGQASVEGSVSLRADVTGSARIRFD
jgi:hypothetical protein